MTTPTTYTGRNFLISRTFDAPRDVVFKAWTEPEQLKQWFGPKGFKGFYGKQELRPGGMYHYGIQGPDGTKLWGRYIYKVIQAPERIECIQSFSDEKGGITRHPFSPNWPAEMYTIFEFKDESNNKTTVTITWIPINPSDEEAKMFESQLDGMNQGWGGSFEQLDEYLATLKK